MRDLARALSWRSQRRAYSVESNAAVLPFLPHWKIQTHNFHTPAYPQLDRLKVILLFQFFFYFFLFLLSCRKKKKDERDCSFLGLCAQLVSQIYIGTWKQKHTGMKGGEKRSRPFSAPLLPVTMRKHSYGLNKQKLMQASAK